MYFLLQRTQQIDLLCAHATQMLNRYAIETMTHPVMREVISGRIKISTGGGVSGN